MINIYKLRYVSKAEALKDLKSKKVIDNEGNYINGTEAVVECGAITLTQATETEEAIYAEGYHYDIMTNDIIVFESEIFVNVPKFKFAN